MPILASFKFEKYISMGFFDTRGLSLPGHYRVVDEALLAETT